MGIKTPLVDRQPIPGESRFRRLVRQALCYIGPGFFVTVGFIDPGNWATNMAAGAEHNYDLLWVVTLSTVILILWQHMSAHLGIVTGKCLAESVRANMNPASAWIYGSTAMLACIATATAEILGAALGISILFHASVKIAAVIATAAIVATVYYQKYNSLEKSIVAFVSIIGLCYVVELAIVRPDWGAVAYHAVVPKLDHRSLIIAMGILGAVVMPHNMYLHSEVIQSRNWTGADEAATRRLLRFEFLDTLIAMLAGLVINAAMVIVAAAVFHRHGEPVTDLAQAAHTLEPLAGKLAGFAFAVALLFAGFSSSTTAAVAGGTTFCGYLGQETRLDGKWFRYGMLLTLIPACLLIMWIQDTFQALIMSQVFLSAQLPLTMLPLFLLTMSKRVMGRFANGWLESSAMVVTGLVVVALNLILLWQVLMR